MPEQEGEGILLLKVRPGTVEAALKELHGKAEVEEAQPVLGTYDVVVTGAFKDIEDLRRFSTAIVGADFCEDCIENVSLERWAREEPQGGAAAAWTLIKAADPERVAMELRKVPAVNAVFSTVGAYDVIAKLAAQSPRELQDSILGRIQTLEGIRRTESLAMPGE